MTKKKFIKNDTKDIFLIVSSFIIGSLSTILICYTTKMPNYNVIKNNTQIYEKNSLAASVEKIYDAVVLVEVYTSGIVGSEGTGFIYKVDNQYGYILTNEHVVSKIGMIDVVLSTDERVPVELVGKDEYLDLAVLKIDKKYVSLVATIGKSEDMKLGDTIFVVGSPLGYNYRNSVTSGVLSGKDRYVTTSTSSITNNDCIMKVLQVDASVNPGNSGGPLLNSNGEVVGVCSLKLVDDDIEGMGFAIPIEDAMKYVETLEKGKSIQWPNIGVNTINVTDESKLNANNIVLPKNIKEGIVVIEVNQTLVKQDLKKGDIITKINEKKVKDTTNFRYELYQHQTGETIDITYIRDNKEKTVKIKLS